MTQMAPCLHCESKVFGEFTGETPEFNANGEFSEWRRSGPTAMGNG